MCIKININAMTRGDAWGKHLLREKPSTENFDDEGYHVRYEDGYESWSRKDVFKKAYKIAETPVDRMQIEAEEVNGRYVKLAAFIDSGKMDEVVNDIYNKCLLEIQCGTMFDYIRLLDTRIQRMQGSDSAEVRKMNFGMAIMALKAGFPIRRSGWNGKGLMVFKQIPAHIESDVIPKMQSLPQSAKDLILKDKGFEITEIDDLSHLISSTESYTPYIFEHPPSKSHFFQVSSDFTFIRALRN